MDQPDLLFSRLKRAKTHKSLILPAIAAIAIPFVAFAYDINEKLSIDGLVSAAYQYQDLSDADAAENAGRGAVVFQPQISFTPTKDDQLFTKFGFATGNGLNAISPFVLQPWAADLEDQVTDINGSERSYLLTLWYKHTITIRAGNVFSLTGGLIDSTVYLGTNAYANDEYNQFMNAAFNNAPDALGPSYDWGAAAVWDVGKLSLRGVVMNVASNDAGNEYNYLGVQAGYTIATHLGEGTYRVFVDTTSKAFPASRGTSLRRQNGITLSFDQEFGRILGGFLRFDWESTDVAITHEALYSIGLNISGKAYGREHDNIGIGYALLDGGNLNIEQTQAAEVYSRFQIKSSFHLTLDLQYMRDELVAGGGPKGFIYGLRLTGQF